MVDVKGYEGLYAVTEDGQVYGYKRKKFLKTQNDNGYTRVTLCKDGQVKRHCVHRLVAEAYIPNPLDLPQVNHKNENKTDNHFSNLEWCTASYNCSYGNRNKKATATKLKNTDGDINKKLKKPVYCVELDQTFDSAKTAAEVTGVCASNIGQVCAGKRKTAGTYHWKYCED